MPNLDLRNPALQKILLSAVLVTGVLGVFFFTHFLPFSYPVQRDHINTLKADYEKKSTDLARARATVADLPRFEAEYEQLHQRWAVAAELLPTERQLATLLRRITLAAQQTGVEFRIFRPGGAKGEQYYTELPMQISVNGGYHQIGSFLAELANMRRIITVSGVRLKATMNPADGYTSSAEFTASAYSLNAGASTESGDQKKGEANGRKS